MDRKESNVDSVPAQQYWASPPPSRDQESELRKVGQYKDPRGQEPRARTKIRVARNRGPGPEANLSCLYSWTAIRGCGPANMKGEHK